MDLSLYLTPKELQTRKRWIQLLVTIPLIQILGPLLIIFLMSESISAVFEIDLLTIFFRLCLFTLSLATPFWLTYFYAYRHPGKKYLIYATIILFLSSLNTIVTLPKEMAIEDSLATGAVLSLAGLCHLIVTFLILWLTIHGWKLGKIHKKIEQAHVAAILASAHYEQACSALNEASSLKGLQHAFETCTKNQSKLFVKIVSRVYKQRKAFLKENPAIATGALS